MGGAPSAYVAPVRKRPAGQPAGRPGEGKSDDRQANVDVAAGRVGVGAHLMCLGYEGFRIGAREARQGDVERDLQAKNSFRARTDTYRRGYRGVGRNLWAALRGNEFHRADEAGRVARRKQLLGIIAGTAASTEFLWRGELDVEGAIKCRGVAIAATGSFGAGLVEHVDRHGSLSCLRFRWMTYCKQLNCAQYKKYRFTFNCSQLNSGCRWPING